MGDSTTSGVIKLSPYTFPQRTRVSTKMMRCVSCQIEYQTFNEFEAHLLSHIYFDRKPVLNLTRLSKKEIRKWTKPKKKRRHRAKKKASKIYIIHEANSGNKKLFKCVGGRSSDVISKKTLEESEETHETESVECLSICSSENEPLEPIVRHSTDNESNSSSLPDVFNDILEDSETVTTVEEMSRLPSPEENIVEAADGSIDESNSGSLLNVFNDILEDSETVTAEMSRLPSAEENVVAEADGSTDESNISSLLDVFNDILEDSETVIAVEEMFRLPSAEESVVAPIMPTSSVVGISSVQERPLPVPSPLLRNKEFTLVGKTNQPENAAQVPNNENLSEHLQQQLQNALQTTHFPGNVNAQQNYQKYVQQKQQQYQQQLQQQTQQLNQQQQLQQRLNQQFQQRLNQQFQQQLNQQKQLQQQLQQQLNQYQQWQANQNCICQSYNNLATVSQQDETREIQLTRMQELQTNQQRQQQPATPQPPQFATSCSSCRYPANETISGSDIAFCSPNFPDDRIKQEKPNTPPTFI